MKRIYYYIAIILCCYTTGSFTFEEKQDSERKNTKCQVKRSGQGELFLVWKLESDLATAVSVTISKVVISTNSKENIISLRCKAYPIFLKDSDNISIHESKCRSSGEYRLNNLLWVPLKESNDKERKEIENNHRKRGKKHRKRKPAFLGSMKQYEATIEAQNCKQNLGNEPVSKPLLVGLRNGSTITPGAPVQLICSIEYPGQDISLSWLKGDEEVTTGYKILKESGQIISTWEFLPDLGNWTVECRVDDKKSFRSTKIHFNVKSPVLNFVQLTNGSADKKEVFWVPFDPENYKNNKESSEEDYDDQQFPDIFNFYYHKQRPERTTKRNIEYFRSTNIEGREKRHNIKDQSSYNSLKFSPWKQNLILENQPKVLQLSSSTERVLSISNVFFLYN